MARHSSTGAASGAGAAASLAGSDAAAALRRQRAHLAHECVSVLAWHADVAHEDVELAAPEGP